MVEFNPAKTGPRLAAALFKADAVLNWIIGFALMVLPAQVDSMIALEPLFPAWVYQLIGAGFTAFAAWQSAVIVRKGSPWQADYVFACAMALLPFAALTAALIFWRWPLEPLWWTIIWVGNVYMLVLGLLYLYEVRRQSQP